MNLSPTTRQAAEQVAEQAAGRAAKRPPTRKAKSKPKANRPGICTVMRVKNESRYIVRAIESLLPLHGEIIILDDGSTDNTGDLVRGFGSVRYIRQDDMSMDEGRDRTLLLCEALKLKPEWIFTLDGDEQLAGAAPERILKAIRQCPPETNVFGFLHAVMWGELGGPESYYPGHQLFKMDRMFRVSACAIAPDLFSFSGQGNGNLHCGCVPPMRERRKETLNAFIKYWGYETREACERKLAFYNEYDPANRAQIRQRVLGRIGCAVHRFEETLDARCCGKQGTVIYE